jgi:hypothetical protein
MILYLTLAWCVCASAIPAIQKSACTLAAPSHRFALPSLKSAPRGHLQSTALQGLTSRGDDSWEQKDVTEWLFRATLIGILAFGFLGIANTQTQQGNMLAQQGNTLAQQGNTLAQHGIMLEKLMTTQTQQGNDLRSVKDVQTLIASTLGSTVALLIGGRQLVGFLKDLTGGQDKDKAEDKDKNKL